MELYGLTKALVIQHAAELARREPALAACFSVTPGWVNTSIIHPADLNTTTGERKCAQQAGSPCPYSPQQGAAVMAVCAGELPAASGSYISRMDGCQAQAPVGHGFLPAMGARLYERALAWANESSA